MSHIRLGLIQVQLGAPSSIASKQSQLEELAIRCLDDGADLVFFPEAFQYVHDRGIIDRPEEHLETARAWRERMAALCRRYHAYIVPWDYERDADGRVYNTSYILDREGHEVGRYRKVHLTNGELSRNLTNGTDFPVFRLDFGTIGIMICFDNYWPESARCLALNGAQLILYPLYGDTLVPNWEIKARCRAIDNCVHLAPCQLDSRYHIAWTGLISPTGDILAKLDDAPTHRVIDVNLGRPVITSTMANPNRRENLAEYLRKCRQPNAYGAITRPVENALPWQDIFFGHEHNY